MNPLDRHNRPDSLFFESNMCNSIWSTYHQRRIQKEGGWLIPILKQSSMEQGNGMKNRKADVYTSVKHINEIAEEQSGEAALNPFSLPGALCKAQGLSTHGKQGPVVCPREWDTVKLEWYLRSVAADAFRRSSSCRSITPGATPSTILLPVPMVIDHWLCPL